MKRTFGLLIAVAAGAAIGFWFTTPSQERVNRLESRIAGLSEKGSNEDDLRQLAAETDSLNSKLDALRTELDAAAARLDAKDTQTAKSIEDLSAKVTSLTARVTSLEQKLALLQTRYNDHLKNLHGQQ